VATWSSWQHQTHTFKSFIMISLII
jgi:hypothetical protein